MGILTERGLVLNTNVYGMQRGLNASQISKYINNTVLGDLEKMVILNTKGGDLWGPWGYCCDFMILILKMGISTLH